MKSNKIKAITAFGILYIASCVTLNNYLGISPFSNDCSTVYATTAKEKKKEAEKKLNDTNSKIDDIKDETQKSSDKIDIASEELDVLISKQRNLNNQIDDLQTQVVEVNAKLETAQKAADDEYEAMKLRIKYMYENADSSTIIQSITETGSIAEMLNKIDYANSIYKSDREMLNNYKNTVTQVSDLKNSLSTKLNNLFSMQEEYESQQAEVEQRISALKSEKVAYENQLSQAEDLAEQYKDTIAEQARIIQEQEAAAARAALEAERAAQAAANANTTTTSSDYTSYTGGGAGASGLSKNTSYLTDDTVNPELNSGISGEDVVAYAMQFVGNPYVWGGNSLTNGVDCSGFVHLVYAHFGISTPRYSQDFKTIGSPVSFNNIKPGDIVVYPGHVAIYRGNGCIVEAQSTKAGITSGRSVSNHTILAIRRVV